jgi:chitodextrinase
MRSVRWMPVRARPRACLAPTFPRRHTQRVATIAPGRARVRLPRPLRSALLAALPAALCAVLLGPASALADENQGWQTDGTHIHSVFGLTMFQTISSRITVPVTTLLHNSGASVDGVRWSCESGVKQTVATGFKGSDVSEESFTVNLTVDPSLCPRGWQEIRVTSDATLPDGSREFTTSRECVNITTGNGTSQNYCGGPTVTGRCGGGAWYAATEYLIAFVDCRDWSTASSTGDGFRPGDKIRVRTQSAGGGGATFDAAFHADNLGVGIQSTPANNAWTTITVPPLPPGMHKLHLRDRLLGFSGAVVMPLKIISDDTTAPTRPGGLTTANVTATGARLSWTASTDNVAVDRYEVFADGVLVGNTKTLSFDVTGLTCGTPHVLGVQARDAAENVSSRAEVTVPTAACQTDTGPPSAPSNLRATATAGTSITLAWDAATDDVGVTGYKVFEDDAFVADVTTGTSFQVTGLTCGTSYLLQVSAFDGAAKVGERGSLTATTSPCAPAGDTTAPSAPANLRATNSTQTTATVAWNAAQDDVGVAGYRVFLDGVQVGDPGNVLTFTYTGLSCGTAHTAQMAAYDAAGNVSELSASLGFTTAACPSVTTVTPAADAYVDANARSTNFGAATALFVQGSPIRRAYMRFAVPAGTPKGAVLRFWSNTSSSSGVSVSVATGTNATTWGESALTFQNAPTFATAIATRQSITSGSNDITIPVAQLTPGAPVTLVVTRTATTRIDIQSKENANKPALVITT